MNGTVVGVLNGTSDGNQTAVDHDDGNFSVDDEPWLDAFKFWIEGAAITAVSAVGIVCNCVSVAVLVRPRMRGSFHTLLVVLSLFDILYLVTSASIFALPALWVWWGANVFPVVAPVAYGVAHIGRVGSVYLTMSVTIERYYAIVHPLRHFSWKKALIPLSVSFSLVYNVPKFFEIRYDAEKNDVTLTDFRMHPDYVMYYMFWSKFVLVEMIPYVTIIVLNTAIMLKIRKSRGFRRRFTRGAGTESRGSRATARSRSRTGRWRRNRSSRREEEDGDDLVGAEDGGGGVAVAFKRTSSRMVSSIRKLARRRSSSKRGGGGATAEAEEAEAGRQRQEGIQDTSEEEIHQLSEIADKRQQNGGVVVSQATPSPRRNSRGNNRGGNEEEEDDDDSSPLSRQRKENMNLAAVLVGISLLFIFCQSAKIVPDLHEVIYCRILPGSASKCAVSAVMSGVVSVSHLLLAVNSSANFVVYTCRGTRFRREMMEMLHCDGKKSKAKGRQQQQQQRQQSQQQPQTGGGGGPRVVKTLSGESSFCHRHAGGGGASPANGGMRSNRNSSQSTRSTLASCSTAARTASVAIEEAEINSSSCLSAPGRRPRVSSVASASPSPSSVFLKPFEDGEAATDKGGDDKEEAEVML